MKKLATKELKAGMYVVDTGLSWLEHPLLYSQEGEIEDQAVIDDIVAEGYTEVFVDPDRGSFREKNQDQTTQEESLDRALAKDKASDPPPVGPATLEDELARAETLYEDSLKFAREFVNDARLGKTLDYDKSAEFVDGLMESVLRNSDALISLSKLRAFDEYTYTHCINVAVLGLAFGKGLGLERDQLRLLGTAGLYHDLGKAMIPPEILNKPGKLTDREFNIMRSHPDKGYQLLKEQGRVPDEVLRGAREHHEKYNGKGYPDKLAGDLIHPLARILAVADVYDALTSERVYKKGMLPNKALSILFGMRGQDFFPGYVERFIKCLGIYPVGSMVRLSSGEHAVVHVSNPEAPLLPRVRIVLDQAFRPRTHEDLDLSQEPKDGLSITDCLDQTEFGVDLLKYLT